MTGALTPGLVARNQALLSEVRLWDWRALKAVYQQFQEIRPYYEFSDVDVDRYHIGGRYRQVLVSARELVPNNLPPESQTFVNRRFVYTHGYGVTLAPVSEFTSSGLPRLLVRDIPPKADFPSLEVSQPQIYYGELTRGPVYVNTEAREFDYPRGDENVYVRYQGTGGVPVGTLWRRFLFGWRFDGTRFLFSSYPRAGSRVLYHREIRERVRRLVPFLEVDEDPYVVLAGGRLYWILDLYTTSTHYPYSTPYSSREEIEIAQGDGRRTLRRTTVPGLDGRNYVRNAVKAVVDAYDGTMHLYVFDSQDPLIRAWRRIFPGLFEDRDRMPDALAAHVRYPQDLLLAQGRVYARYHMTDPDVFYNQEDLWVRATEKYRGDVRPVSPYYVMWQAPGSDRIEFILMLPFTPKDRQVLIGWIAGRCDPPHYGRFLVYQLPKEERILGPQQVETKIDQDPQLSSQLTLWDQRGSRVIRGNMLAIPIEDTLLYVEPIYLQADTAAYPELRLVAVMHGDTLAHAPDFRDALDRLIAGGPPARAPAPTAASPGASLSEARAAFDDLKRAFAEGRFADAGRALERLGATLGASPPTASPGSEGDDDRD
jgi:uncharacterized membrane protein (UPF0182 family)